jgi:hypothetical protein
MGKDPNLNSFPGTFTSIYAGGDMTRPLGRFASESANPTNVTIFPLTKSTIQSVRRGEDFIPKV